jgi:predicted nucleic acid-binding protein
LVEQCADLDLGIVDATVIALAEQLREEKLATLDQCHFTVVRPTHIPAFTLLPAR